MSGPLRWRDMAFPEGNGKVTLVDLPSYFPGGYERNGQFMRQCLAHDDKGPSLSIRMGDHGAWLVNCFAGCPTEDVLASVGLDMGDLFPDRPQPGARRSQHQLSARDALQMIRHESMVIACAAASLLDGTASQEAIDRVRESVTRIQTIIGAVHGLS